MVLPMRLVLLDEIDIANVLSLVAWTYLEGTQKNTEGVMRKKGDCHVLHEGMVFSCIDVEF